MNTAIQDLYIAILKCKAKVAYTLREKGLYIIHLQFPSYEQHKYYRIVLSPKYYYNPRLKYVPYGPRTT